MSEQSFGGPYVQVAVICATPLIEQQGYLSVIRIQDRIQIAGQTEQMRPQPLHNLSLVLVLKAGEMKGKYSVHITPITPSGKELASVELPVLFEGEERGVVIAIPVAIVAEEEGLYWFNITMEGAALTRIPLRVMYQRQMQAPFGMFQPPPSD